LNLPNVGHVLGGKYEIIRLLGEGGMGAVFEAENKLTHKRVAIKWLLPELSAGSASARLLREAQAASRVRHSNVVDVYDVEREGDAIFLVMELLEGETLKHAMARRDLPMHEFIALIIPALRGVAAAHRQGVIHRDVKPENIFLAREDEYSRPVPKVLDFGISKLEERGRVQQSLTRTGNTVGTPLYMSYEQLAGDRGIDGRADVYAFGVILYEGLTGRLPFDANSLAKLVVRIATEVAPAPRSLQPEIPASLSHVVMRAIARQREERTASVEALIKELEPFATEQGFLAEQLRTDVTSHELKGASEPTPLAASAGFLSQATEPNAVQPTVASTVEVHGEPQLSEAAPSQRPYPLFGATQRRARFAPPNLTASGEAPVDMARAAQSRSTPPRLKASGEHSSRRRPRWLGLLALFAFAAPLAYRLLRGPRQSESAETSAQTDQPAAHESKHAGDRNATIPTTASTRSSDATEQDWDLARPVQVTYEQNVAAGADASTALPLALAEAGVAAPIEARGAAQARPTRHGRRAIAGDAGALPAIGPAANKATLPQTPAAAAALAKEPERSQPVPSEPNISPFRVRPPKAQEF
jgi:serine/threonine-protein kinase